jgi:hypothetical protein
VAGGDLVTLVTNIFDWVDYWQGLFVDSADALGVDSQMIYYGDQDRLPGYPAICFEPDDTGYEIIYTGRKANINFGFFILVYHGEIRNPQINRRDADVLAAACADLVHSHFTGQGRVISCQVDRITSGSATKAGTLVRASRLTVSAMSQSQLPLTP